MTVNKPLTLVAEPGAEIRGSDVWATGWARSGAYWVHPGVPSFNAHGSCKSGTTRCLWPEQVFYGGTPLVQVGANPTSGQFAVATDRTLIIADDPSVHFVETTMRQYWIVVASDNVALSGFIMRHAANDAQDGAIQSHGYSNVTIQKNHLRHAHGAIVSLKTGNNLQLLNNNIGRGGQLGVLIVGATDVLVQGNDIRENNVDLFDWQWEAGGLKAVRAVRLTLDANVVWGNDGAGLWCDIGCRDVTYSNNRIYNNVWVGIFFETSTGARIVGNTVWNNGWGKAVWGWGAGILAASSSDVEVYRNVVAWNASGIAVISQSRGDAPSTNGTVHFVHDNTIVMLDGVDAYALGWLQDWAGPMLSPSAKNIGSMNRFGYSGLGDTGAIRFAWESDFSSIAAFSGTPGGGGSLYLSAADQDTTLKAAGVPLTPPARP